MKFSLKATIAGLMFSSAVSMASTIDLIGENLFPEGIAYRSATQSFYVGSAGNGSLQIVKNGESKVIQAAGLDGKTSLLGIKVDEKFKRLWVLEAKAAYIYELETNKLIKKISLSSIVDVKDSFLNDLAIDDEGNAYITDSYNPHILKVDGKNLEMSVFRELPEVDFGNQNDMPYNFNGIVLSQDKKSLVIVKTNDGSLWNLNLTDLSITEYKLAQAVTKGDGLVLDSENNLYVIRNFINTVSKISLGSTFDEQKLYSVETLDVAHLDIPTTAAIDEESNSLVIVNSQFGKTELAPFVLSVHQL